MGFFCSFLTNRGGIFVSAMVYVAVSMMFPNKNHCPMSVPLVSYGSSMQATLAQTAKKPYTETALQMDDWNRTCATYGVAMAPSRARAEQPPTPTERSAVG